MALYFGAALSVRGLHGLFLVGPQRDHARRFFLGRLAWINADVRVLPHLRRKNGIVRRAHTAARFCLMRDLVCNRCGAFPVAHERHPRHLLHMWWPLYFAGLIARVPAGHALGGNRSFDPFCPAFWPDVALGQATEPGKGGAAGHDHCLLVVLQ